MLTEEKDLPFWAYDPEGKVLYRFDFSVNVEAQSGKKFVSYHVNIEISAKAQSFGGAVGIYNEKQRKFKGISEVKDYVKPNEIESKDALQLIENIFKAGPYL